MPFRNLWRPKRIANDIWRGTGPDRGYGLLNAWWTVWIVSNVVDQISFRVTLGSASVSTADTVSVVSDLFDLVAAVLGILVVRALTAREEGAAARTR